MAGYVLLDDEPAPKQAGYVLLDDEPKRDVGVLEGAGMGVLRGAKDVIDTGANWLASGFDKLAGTREGERVRQMNDAGKADFARSYGDSTSADLGRIAGQVAATWPVGGVLGGAVRGAGALTGASRVAEPIAQAIATGGLRAGGLGGAAGMATRMAGGAITGGATAGLVNPDDAVAGAVAGAALPVAVKGLGAAGSVIGRQLRPAGESADLARRAMDMGAPLGIADIADGKFTKAVRSVLNDAPFTGGIGQTQNEAKQRWFNRAVGEVFDAAEDKLTPQVMDKAKQKMGAEFDRIWNNNSLVVDDKLLQSLSKTRTSAKMLPAPERARILSMLGDLESQVVAGADGAMVIPGEVANRYQSAIRKSSESAQGFLKSDLNALRGDIIGAFNRSVGPEDAAALALNQKKYKAFKTVEPLLNKGELGVAGRQAGDVPAGLLPGGVLQSYKSNPAGSPLAELSKIGSRYLVDRSPQTGGSARALIQNSAIGGALGAGVLTNPLLALPVIPAGMATNRLLGSPVAARGLLNAATPQMPGLLSLAQKTAPVLTAQ